VENGADAIYFGLERFNARMRAQNFTEADLPKLMGFLHSRGVKGYVTFNTLVFENEMSEAEQYAYSIIAARVDAAIVQDVGICRLLRELSPDFPIHASTQMTITSAVGIAFARELGCNLVVLARECSVKEIEKIQAAQGGVSQDLHEPHASNTTPEKVPTPLPLEVFVHGALCVAYSGQCLTSEALGGRSANRGECAQACRMPYDLIADGMQVPLGDRKYLLSPQDLAGLQMLPELVRLGMGSLKIEGRLKSPQYVASITRIYRQALDSLAREPVPGKARHSVRTAPDRPSIERRAWSDAPYLVKYEMEMAFSRGLYTGWFAGVNNQELVHGRFGKKRGVYLGEVTGVRSNAVVLLVEGPLKPGDGVVFDAGNPEEKEEGGRVYEIRNLSHKSHTQPASAAEKSFVLLSFGRGDIDFNRVHVGDKLWKTSDPQLEKQLRQTFEGDQPKFQRPVSIEVHGVAGKPLNLIMRDELGHVVRVDSRMPLVQANKQTLTRQRLAEQMERLGGTPFKLQTMTNLLEGEVMLPISELNRLRREAVKELLRIRERPNRWTINTPRGDNNSVRLQGKVQSAHPLTPALSPSEGERGDAHAARLAPRIVVLVRNLAQLEAALQQDIPTFYCDFEDPKKYREAVSRFRAHKGKRSDSTIFVAPPRIFKMGEEWILKQVRSSEADGYLIRNYDHLAFFPRERCVGDYSLNIANRMSAEYFKTKFSLERMTASYDLNFSQLEALLRTAPPEWFEVTIHQHMPMFHMEHCLFCAFLSSGTDYTNCGRPCDTHDVKVRDRVAAEHPVKADAGCRNTVFNARAQTGAEYVARMLALGVRHFRLEFVNEPPQLVNETIDKYQQLIRGELTGAQLWRELKLFNQLGVTRGQMEGRG
jgi:putative protease